MTNAKYPKKVCSTCKTFVECWRCGAIRCHHTKGGVAFDKDGVLPRKMGEPVNDQPWTICRTCTEELGNEIWTMAEAITFALARKSRK
jgi:hypothetical protein